MSIQASISLTRLFSLALLIMLLSNLASANTDDIERYIVTYKTGAKDRVVQSIDLLNGDIQLAIDKHRLIAVNLSLSSKQSLTNNTRDIQSIETDSKHFLMSETIPYGFPITQVNPYVTASTLPSPTRVSEALTTDRKVCIIDSGFDTSHEDLQNARITGDDEITYTIGNTVYTSHDTGFWHDDESGHGTMIAGIIAALGGNDLGIQGVNPGDKLYLHIVKTFVSSPTGQSFWVYGSTKIAALEQCLAAGAHIVNMSFGSYDYTSAENQAFISAAQSGVLLIAASGNFTPLTSPTAYRYPANLDAVMSVSSVDANENIASDSVHNQTVDLSAPGVSIYSTVPTTVFGGNKYAVKSGTSLATAYVSGIAALIWGHYPSCSGYQIWRALQNTAKDKGPIGKDNYYGHGIIQAKAAYDAIGSAFALNQNCNVPPPPTSIQSGVPVNSLIAASGSQLEFVINVDPSLNTSNTSISAKNSTLTQTLRDTSSNNLVVELSGGTGNADLYVRYGAKPSTDQHDCSSTMFDSNESCSISEPQSGKYYVMVKGSTLFYGVSLKATYIEPDKSSTPNNSNTSTEINDIDENKSESLEGSNGINSEEGALFHLLVFLFIPLSRRVSKQFNLNH